MFIEEYSFTASLDHSVTRKHLKEKHLLIRVIVVVVFEFLEICVIIFYRWFVVLGHAVLQICFLFVWFQGLEHPVGLDLLVARVLFSQENQWMLRPKNAR